METWTFHAPLVSGTHLFGACLAQGAQECWSFLGDVCTNIFYGHLNLAVSCSVLVSPEKDFGLFNFLSGSS